MLGLIPVSVLELLSQICFLTIQQAALGPWMRLEVISNIILKKEINNPYINVCLEKASSNFTQHGD